MLTKASLIAIDFYQYYLSPHKGYCCAHRVYTGEDSCSQYAKHVIAQYGLIEAFPLIRNQFDRCSYAAKKLQQEKEKKKKKSDAETLGDYACDIGCRSVDCLDLLSPKSCGGRSGGNACIDSCDIGGDCNPFG